MNTDRRVAGHATQQPGLRPEWSNRREEALDEKLSGSELRTESGLAVEQRTPQLSIQAVLDSVGLDSNLCSSVSICGFDSCFLCFGDALESRNSAGSNPRGTNLNCVL